LEEYNPGAFTKEALATSIDGYETLINQCYFAMERFYYGSADWMSLTEGDTDLWTYKANESTSYTQWFWFFAGTSPNTTRRFSRLSSQSMRTGKTKVSCDFKSCSCISLRHFVL
jgi:hypothetical protein